MTTAFLARSPDDVLGSAERLRVLSGSGLMEAGHDEHLDRWAQGAAEALGAAISLVSLIDERRQLVKAVVNGPGAGAPGELPLTHSFCQYVVGEGRPMAVDDARRHEVLRGNGAVADLGVVAYAGAPIVVAGQSLGALCVIGGEPRAWRDADLRLLAHLADGLAHEVELRMVVTELTRSNSLIQAHNRIDELIAGDEPLVQILTAIVMSVEAHDPDLYGSVMLFDDEQQVLRAGAGDRLSPDYRAALDGVRIGATSGSCSAAAFSGEEVVSADLRTDDSWDEFRHLVDPLGLRHCWAFPVTRSDGAVLGTFSAYGTRPRSPGDDERRVLRDAAKLVGIAIERREARDRLVHDATHDLLTGLPNRAVAFERLDEILDRSLLDSAAAVSVLFVSLDRLEVVNDSLGHWAGDHVVRQAAQRLSGCAAEADLVARLDGATFLIASAGDHDRAADLSARILSAVGAPTTGLREGPDLIVTASLGIAVVADRDTDAHGAIHRAATAMRLAKARGGDAYDWADGIDVTAASRRLGIENGLRHAIERDELSVVYQPLQRFGTGRVSGFEALLRWTHGELGAVSPDEFIPIAEQSGLIHELGAWALQTACAALPALLRAHGPELFLSVNVSPQQLRAPALPSLVAQALEQHGLSADRLWIEITETALLGNDPETATSVAVLHEMGATIALDDFGTGYSSLAILKQHPIGALKIDRSFVDGILENPDDLPIVTALVALGKGLGLRVVAEGVETRDQHEVLRTLGCDYAQGYLVGRPAPQPQPDMPSRRAG